MRLSFSERDKGNLDFLLDIREHLYKNAGYDYSLLFYDEGSKFLFSSNGVLLAFINLDIGQEGGCYRVKQVGLNDYLFEVVNCADFPSKSAIQGLLKPSSGNIVFTKGKKEGLIKELEIGMDFMTCSGGYLDREVMDILFGGIGDNDIFEVCYNICMPEGWDGEKGKYNVLYINFKDRCAVVAPCLK